MTENPILHTYKGEWGLPSIDFDSLRALCAVKFTKAPITISNANKTNPLRSGRGRVPYIKAFNRNIVGYKQILGYLQELGYSINDQLSRNLSNLAEAYECLVFNDLHPYFQYFLYGSPENMDTTRKLYAVRTSFPFNFYYPGTYMKHADEVMEVFGGFSVHDKLENHCTELIVLNAKKCVNLLSSKLAKNKWFFGSHPSTFDILVYAYLSVLLKISLPNHPLQVHLQECPNLIQYVNRITKDYFVEEGYSSEADKRKNTSSKNATETATPTSDLESSSSTRQTKILAAVVAFLAMSAYATWMGILKIGDSYYDQIGYRDDDDDYDDDES